MKSYLIYKTNTGEITATASYPIAVDIANVLIKDDESIIFDLTSDELSIDFESYYIANNKLTLRIKKPSINHEWDGKNWILNNNKEAELIRCKRNQLLIESDWTDTLSAKQRLGDDLYNQWQVYRQLLRDITLQDGFPLNIVWPTTPT